ncbi:hypothetical protein ACSBR2_005857 [Camellia fascicularis]
MTYLYPNISGHPILGLNPKRLSKTEQISATPRRGKSELKCFLHFPSAETESENVETDIFLDSLKEKNFLASDSPAFISLETSESNYFSMLPIQMENFEFFQNLGHSKSDLAEIIGFPTWF